MTKPDEAILGLGSIAFALSAVSAYIADAFCKDETDIHTELLARPEYKRKPQAAGDRVKRVKRWQRTPFFVLWLAGLVLSILAFAS
jgi:hypothetical protein